MPVQILLTADLSRISAISQQHGAVCQLQQALAHDGLAVAPIAWPKEASEASQS